MFQFFPCNLLSFRKEKQAATSLTVNSFREREYVGVTMSFSAPEFTKHPYKPEKRGQRNRGRERDQKRERREKLRRQTVRQRKKTKIREKNKLIKKNRKEARKEGRKKTD